MKSMQATSRQRVLAALDHREGDRVPVIANLAAPVAAKVASRLGLACGTEPFRALNTLISGRASFNELLVALGNDCIGVAAESLQSNTETHGTGEYRDEWKLAYCKENGYLEVVSRPLSTVESVTEIRNFHIPDPSLPERWVTAKKLMDVYGESHGVIGCMGQTMFETCWNLIGFEKFLMDFLSGEEYLLLLLDRLTEYSIACSDELSGLGCDIIFIGDDVGMQDRMLISAASWRELLKPRLGRICQHIKARKNPPRIAYHSCGSIVPIIPDLMEIGVDILNPVQPMAYGMELKPLKAQFGDRLCFWGGIDVQRCIPFGTVQEIQAQVRQCIEDAASGGGFIIAPAHIIPSETSAENVIAFFDAVQQFGSYS